MCCKENHWVNLVSLVVTGLMALVGVIAGMELAVDTGSVGAVILAFASGVCFILSAAAVYLEVWDIIDERRYNRKHPRLRKGGKR